MRIYDVWQDPYVARPRCRVSGDGGAYWLPRRRDLLIADVAGVPAVDRLRNLLRELAVDLLADATGCPDMARRAEAEYARHLGAGGVTAGGAFCRDTVCNWVIGWVARELGMLPDSRPMEGADNVTL